MSSWRGSAWRSAGGPGDSQPDASQHEDDLSVSLIKAPSASELPLPRKLPKVRATV